MAEGGVEDAAFTVHFGPGDGEIVFGAVDAGVVVVVEFAFVQAEQDVDFIAGEFLGLVDFVALHEGFGEVAGGGEAGVFVDDWGPEGVPGVLVEPAADHFAVLGPFVVGVEGGVDADEAFALVVDDGEEVLFLLVGEVEFAGCAGEDDGVEFVEIFPVGAEFAFGEELGVGAYVGVPEAGIAAHFPDGAHGVGDGIVLEAFGLADDEDALFVDGEGGFCAVGGGENEGADGE